MALIPCPECGRQVSDTASACPNCGAAPRAEKISQPKKTSGCAWAAAVLVGLPFLIFSVRCSDRMAQAPERPAAAAPAAAAPEDRAATEARLEECRRVLKESQELDLLHNMTFDDGRPKVWVGQTWYQLPVEGKTEFARTAACFFLAGRDKAITFPIYDGRSGRQVATWRFTRLEFE